MVWTTSTAEQPDASVNQFRRSEAEEVEDEEEVVVDAALVVAPVLTPLAELRDPKKAVGAGSSVMLSGMCSDDVPTRDRRAFDSRKVEVLLVSL